MRIKHGQVFLLCFMLLLSLKAFSQNDKNLLDLSLDELLQVKVTSEKREQQWIDVPQTIDVFSGSQLRDQDINGLNSLAELATGFSYGRVGNISNVYLRGIGSDLISIAADASTAVYLNDVYLSRAEMSIGHFWDLDRVEILKGPQGALYGRNATGGAIKIVSARASFDKSESYTNLGVGSFNQRKLEAATGVSLTDSLAARVSVFSVKDDGYTQDLDPAGGSLIDDNNVKAGRAELRYRFGSNWETSLTADYYKNNTHGASLRPNDHKGLAEAQGVFAPSDFHEVRNNISSFSDYSTQGVVWRWNWTGEQVELESVTGYRKLNSNYLFNTDGTEAVVVESQFLTNQEQYSQDIHLQSTADADLRWMVGINWLHEMPVLQVGLIRHPINTSIDILANADTRASAIYGELGWKINSQWNSTLRLRESDERRNDTNRIFSTGDLLGLDSPKVDLPRPLTANRTSSFKKLSPQWGINFVPNSSNGRGLWYLNITEGYKSGGANSLSTGPSFKPEEILSYELGYKNIDTSGRWSASLFHYDYHDLQVVTFEKGVTAISNAASANIDGLDVAKLFNLDEKTLYEIGATLLQAKYSTFITSLAGAAKDVSGNTMPYAPQIDFNQRIRREFRSSIGIFDVELAHHYQSKTYFSQFEDAAVSQGARNRLDLISNWVFSDRWKLHAAIYNLTDSQYFQNIVRFTTTSVATAPEGNALGYTAAGRRWVLGLRYTFD